MLTFNLYPTLTAIIYFLGMVLHHLHVVTVFHLAKTDGKMDNKRLVLYDLIWPWIFVDLAIAMLFDDEEEDE